MTLAHVAVAAVLLAMLVNMRGLAEAVRGFVQGVNEPAEARRD